MATDNGYFDSYASLYDQLQPILIENYRQYHLLALDFVLGRKGENLRVLDLGCGTGTFLELVLRERPNWSAIAIDYSQEMLDAAAQKPAINDSAVELTQGDLADGLAHDVGTFDLIFSFSAIHHLNAARKSSLINQVFDALNPGGQFFLIDAMFDQFCDSVFATGRDRERRLRQKRLDDSGFPLRVYEQFERIKSEIADESPEKDRIGTVKEHLTYLEQAGFSSVDHVWHQWFEHFFIAEKLGAES